jgi:metallophosphoesterase (TIGR03768 family)
MKAQRDRNRKINAASRTGVGFGKPFSGLTRREFMKLSAGAVAWISVGSFGYGCGGNSTGSQTTEWPIVDHVFTTAEQQTLPVGLSAATPKINPADVPLYTQFGYSDWQAGTGLDHVKRAELAPGYAGAPNAARLLTFFSMTDIHICDKESPAQANYVGWSAQYGPTSAGATSAYSPVILSSTQVFDAAVRTINALHKRMPFDFGISLGDTINNAQYNELRWYLDVLDGKVITPSSGAHDGADTIDYQRPFKAAGLDKSIPWYQVIGNHDQFFLGSFWEYEKTLSAHIGSTVINYENTLTPSTAGLHGTGCYMGVVDGTTPYGDIIKAGPEGRFPAPPTVIADPDRRSLATSASSSLNWMREFFSTTSNPVGHGFTQTNLDNDFASYIFEPKSNIPIKVIALDDTVKGPTQPNYALGGLDQARFDWLTAELQKGQDEGKLMIIAAHIPINPQNSFADPANFSFFRAPGFTEATLLPILHSYPNLILWISGHRHVNVVTPQPAPAGKGPEYGFWEVETASLRDFPQQFRAFDIRRNSDNTVSILVTNIDPAVEPGSPAAKSRGYAIGAARIFGATDAVRADTRSMAYNAELVKQLTPAMQAKIADYGSAIG